MVDRFSILMAPESHIRALVKDHGSKAYTITVCLRSMGANRSEALPLPNSTVHKDDQLVASWCYEPSTRNMVSYDTVEIARIKADYINNKCLGGAMCMFSSYSRLGIEL